MPPSCMSLPAAKTPCQACLVLGATHATRDRNQLVWGRRCPLTCKNTRSVAPPVCSSLPDAVQMERSAVASTTTFSVAIKTELAPVGTAFKLLLRRHQCDVPSATPYQDPYRCPGYNPVTDSNSCAHPIDKSGNAVELEFLCTVGDDHSCVAEAEWPVYISEFYGGKELAELRQHTHTSITR